MLDIISFSKLISKIFFKVEIKGKSKENKKSKKSTSNMEIVMFICLTRRWLHEDLSEIVARKYNKWQSS